MLHWAIHVCAYVVFLEKSRKLQHYHIYVFGWSGKQVNFNDFKLLLRLHLLVCDCLMLSAAMLTERINNREKIMAEQIVFV